MFHGNIISIVDFLSYACSWISVQCIVMSFIFFKHFLKCVTLNFIMWKLILVTPIFVITYVNDI